MKKTPKKSKKKVYPNAVKGYKIFNPDFTCNGMQYKENSEFKHVGAIKICGKGLHFCLAAHDCFNYYSFDPNNIVCEVQAIGNIEYHDSDSKACTDHLLVGRRLTWHEVLRVANSGSNNTGHSNSGYSNSGNRNSGDSNSGNRNSGNRNSGNSNSGSWNSGDRNSGDWNSGERNSGSWNSGDRNSGDCNSGDCNSGYRNSGECNSGYRSSGAFCTDPNPTLILFDKPTKITVKEWELHKAVELMKNIDPTIWVPSYSMTYDEKKDHPEWETTEGYIKTITMKEAWANAWHNFTKADKKVFTSLPNFDAKKFEEITGIKLS